MGELSTTLLHQLTDRMAARLKADLDGIIAERAAATLISLAHTVDTSSDPALQAALMASANNLDLGGVPANLATALASLLSQARYTAFAQAIGAYVVSADGGGYASLADYLAADATRQVHPLAAEVFRAVGPLGPNAFTLSDDVVGCFAPNYQAAFPKRVYTGADGALVDDTTDATDVDAADVALFAADDHYLYLGFDTPIEGLIVGLSTVASEDITGLSKYWDGSQYATLTKDDNSVGFTRNGYIGITTPDNWAPWYKDVAGNEFADKTPRYYLAIQRTANVMVTPPVASLITGVPVATLNASDQHLGVDQPPLAICEITGANAIEVTPIADVDIARFNEPALRLRALTPIASNLTPTVSYTNQDGDDVAQAQAEWPAPAVLDTVAVTLNGADTGAQAALATGWAVTTAATHGVFALEAAELRAPAI